MFRKQAQDIKMGTILFEKWVSESGVYFILQFISAFESIEKQTEAPWSFIYILCILL
jgi:lysozyme family protein